MKDIEFFEEREDQVVLQDEEIGSNEEADQDDLQVAAPLDFRVASFSQGEDKDDSNAAQQAGCYREELADLRQRKNMAYVSRQEGLVIADSGEAFLVDDGVGAAACRWIRGQPDPVIRSQEELVDLIEVKERRIPVPTRQDEEFL